MRNGPGGELIWYVFLTGYAQTVQVPFGLVGDQVGVSDIDGDGMVELVALRNNFNWYVRKPFLDRSTTTVTQWGRNGDIPLLPRDIDNDGLAEFIISRTEGAGQVAYVKYSNGQSGTIPLGFSNSIPQVGNFGTNSNFAWSQRDTGWTAIRNSDGSPYVFRLRNSSNVIIRPDGTVVQPSSSATFPSGSATQVSTNSAIPACRQTYSSGWLLKPMSQDSGGDRQGKPMILFSRNLPTSDCLEVLALDVS